MREIFNFTEPSNINKLLGNSKTLQFLELLKSKWDVLYKETNVFRYKIDSLKERIVDGKYFLQVWCDFKNNAIKKCAKMHRTARGADGGPALRVALTDLEERVMAIVGEQAATGLPIPEAGLQDQVVIHTRENRAASVTDEETAEEVEPTSVLPHTVDCDWNMPGTSSQDTVMWTNDDESRELPVPLEPRRLSSPPARPAPQTWRRSQKKRKRIINSKVDAYKYAFLHAEKRAREYERERDIMFFDLKKERIRQRHVELRLHAQWLEFMKEALNVMKNIMEAKKRDE